MSSGSRLGPRPRAMVRAGFYRSPYHQASSGDRLPSKRFLAPTIHLVCLNRSWLVDSIWNPDRPFRRGGRSGNPRLELFRSVCLAEVGLATSVRNSENAPE